MPWIEPGLRRCLREAWGIGAGVRALLVGGGGQHWVAEGGRWFVTVHELPGEDAYADLAACMRTARELAEVGLGFVAAPVAARDGRVVVPLEGYAVSVRAYLDGVAGDFFDVEAVGDRVGVAGMLAGLHGATGRVAAPPVRAVGLGARGALEEAIGGLRRSWRGGPYAEDARTVLGRDVRVLREALGRFDALAAEGGGPRVVTHGEPHPGNLLRGGAGRWLIDWDTVGMAPPERDLWMTVWPPGAPGRPALRAPLDRYRELTGRDVGAAGLELYRLRWYLNDIAIFTALLRGPHEATADTRKARDALAASLRVLAAFGPS